MSQWHRANPELAGTDADPWMMHESYRRARAMPSPPPNMPSWAWIEENTTHRCHSVEGCGRVQARNDLMGCRYCEAPLHPNEP